MEKEKQTEKENHEFKLRVAIIPPAETVNRDELFPMSTR